MTISISPKDPFFTPFVARTDTFLSPDKFILDEIPHPLCLLATKELQQYLTNQTEWDHNFGLSIGGTGAIIGKMFGVLAVKTRHDEVGYLAAFSGKLAGGNDHSRFVPAVFDGLTDNSFVNNGMKKLTHISQQIKELENLNATEHKVQINVLKAQRRSHSSALQKKIFDHYHFLNRTGEEKSLNEIFKTASYKNPPSGAGECAAPKLLQYAFQNNMRPLALAEFWWGLSPKSDLWKHGHFYPCCREKCHPILAHMLAGING